MAEHRARVHITRGTTNYINGLLSLNAGELYDKHGIKRYEQLYSTTAKFENGMEVDVNVCSCDEDCPFIDAVLFDENGSELACEVNEDGAIETPKCVCFEDDEYWVDFVVIEEEAS